MRILLISSIFSLAACAPNRRLGDDSYADFPEPKNVHNYEQSSEELPALPTPRMRLPTLVNIQLTRATTTGWPDSDENDRVIDRPAVNQRTSTISQSNEDSMEDGMTYGDFVRANICKANIARMCFDDADVNGDNRVTKEELRNYQHQAMARAENLYSQFQKHNFQLADTNGDGSISKEEAGRFAQDELKIVNDSEFYRFLNRMNKDGDGKLDRKEFNDFLDSWYRNDSHLHLSFNDYAESTTEAAPVEDISPEDWL